MVTTLPSSALHTALAATLLFGHGVTAQTEAEVAPSRDVAVLLITDQGLAEAWRPFAAWKTSLGKPTEIVTVQHIEEHYEAESIQEQIRLCVRDHVDHRATRWVVLGGDCTPDGKGLVPGGHTTVHRQEPRGIPTDIVYLSPTNWDADNDGIYGEWEDDREAISYPDGTIALGRIPVRTADDVAAFTAKVIAYETRYPQGEFATQMVYTCTDDPAYPKVRKSWDSYVSKAWETGNVARYFSKETPWDDPDKPGSYPLSAENVVAMFNRGGVGKVHIHGHGHLPAWVLEKSRFTRDHIEQLENENAYPLITTVSCNTGEFDGQQDPSIVEAMIRRPRGGSVAVVAPVRTGKPHFHQRSDFRLMVTEGKLDGTTWTMTHYWSLGLGKQLTTGEALMASKATLAEDAAKSANYHLCICELNLLGDPTLDMRAATPSEPALTLPKHLSAGTDRVLEVGTEAAGSTVCAWKGDEVYLVATTDDQGNATLKLPQITAGILQVTVSGPSLNAVTADVAIED